ncbi:MAG: DNA-binding response regulator [Phycisphaeraceae bacterium]|nr:MAG: DNA-binding response regulator [Phycisphaeraceae bacterium]
MSTGRLILVVDDEPDLTELLTYNLKRAGYNVLVAANGVDALRLAEEHSPDLVLLDIMMPELDGREVARRLRRSAGNADVPIVMLTARGEEADELTGLALGADDYVIKPFSMQVLLARLEAVLRRTNAARAGEDDEQLEYGPIHVDTGVHVASLEGVPLQLTVTEFKLLSALIAAEGKVLSRPALISRAMGPGVTVTERTIDVHVTAIRKKLGAHAAIIRTVRGVGYRVELAQQCTT